MSPSPHLFPGGYAPPTRALTPGADAVALGQRIFNELLTSLAGVLGQVHQVKHSSAFWECLLAPWLSAHVEIVLAGGYPPRVELAAGGLSIPAVHNPSDIWHKSCMLHYDCLTATDNPTVSLRFEVPALTYPDGWLERLLFRTTSGLLAIPSAMDPKAVRSVCGHFGRTRKRGYAGLNTSSITFNLDLRRRIAEEVVATAQDDNTRRCAAHLAWSLPISLVEAFSDYYRFARRHAGRYQVVWLDARLYAEYSLVFIMAFVRENGGRIVGQQHGGAYGMATNLFQEMVERRLADSFITWGWQDDRYGSRDQCVPLPNSALSSRLDALPERFETNAFLWISNSCYPRPIHLAPDYHPQSAETYYGNRHQAYAALPPSIQQMIVYRPFFRSFDWPQEESFRRNFPGRLNQTRGMIDFPSCGKLLILDHPGTCFLEAMALNYPCVGIWPSELFAMRPHAEAALALLRQAGIVHDEPAAFAAHLETLSSDPRGWWYSEQVQHARASFSRQYAWTSPDYLERWRQFGETLHHTVNHRHAS